MAISICSPPPTPQAPPEPIHTPRRFADRSTPLARVRPCTTRGGPGIPPAAGRQRPAPLLSCTRNLRILPERVGTATCWN
jgi:hypothetical protein